MRDVARFDTALTIASVASYPNRLFVADEYNCRLAEVVISPGLDFLTNTTTIYRSCYSPSLAIPYPILLTPVLNGQLLLFLTDLALMQFDLGLRVIQAIVAAEYLPPNPLYIGMSGDAVAVYNATSVALITSDQLPCPQLTVAAVGGVCLPCPMDTFVEDGVCKPCTVLGTCAPGTYPHACAVNYDAYCQACSTMFIPSPNYTWTVGCSFTLSPPCLPGYYRDTAGGTVCHQCPQWSTNTISDAVGVGACTCYNGGTMSIEHKNCSIPPLWVDGGLAGPYDIPSWIDVYGCTVKDCPHFGCYLSSITPLECTQCPPGSVSSQGFMCYTCASYMDAAPTQDWCVCKANSALRTGWTGPDQCICSHGYGTGGDGLCAPCADGTYANGSTADLLAGTPNQACTPCPPGFTSNPGHTGCVPCPVGLYRTAGMSECAACPNPDAYAADATTPTSCTLCTGVCAQQSLWSLCPINVGLYACTPCADVWPASAVGTRVWVDASYNQACLFTCAPGMYTVNDTCVPCTVARACPAGLQLTQCSAYADSNCDLACDNTTMPASDAEYYPSTDGCPWRCVAGCQMIVKQYFDWVEYYCEPM